MLSKDKAFYNSFNTVLWIINLDLKAFFEKCAVSGRKYTAFTLTALPDTQELAMCIFLLLCQPCSPRNYPQVIPGLVEITFLKCQFVSIQISQGFFFPPSAHFSYPVKPLCWLTKACTEQVLTQSHQLKVWRNRKRAISFSFMDIKNVFLFLLSQNVRKEQNK